MKKTQEKIKNEIGITLIALAITIIVLLILTGVTISAIGGQSGILKNAVNAKKQSMEADLKEEIRIIEQEEVKKNRGETEETQNYQKIIDKIDENDNALNVENDKLEYNPDIFTTTEQRILRNEFRLGSTKDTTKPYGTIEKEVVDGKVKLKIYTADDETDVDRIILPDGSEKEIIYDTENILFRYNNKTTDLVNSIKNNKIVENLKAIFKNVTEDCSNLNISEIDEYNIILDWNQAWSIRTEEVAFIEECFNYGKNIVVSSDDISKSPIIKDSKSIDYQWQQSSAKKIVENEVTKKFTKNTISEQGKTRIHYIDDVDVWINETVKDNNNEYDIAGIIEGLKGNKWIDWHTSIDIKIARNSIYRATDSRSAEYEITKNGTYKFTVIDLSGNKEEVSISVNEL